MSYASNVIVNFGSNASQLFKGMQKVKAEIRDVQAQAVKGSLAVAATGKRLGFQAFMPAFALSGAGRLGGLFSVGARFGAYGVAAAAVTGGILAAGRGIVTGFKEQAQKYSLFGDAIDSVSAKLTSFGKVLADYIIPTLQNLAVDTGLVESPYGPITAKQQAAFDQRMIEVRRRQTDERNALLDAAQKKLVTIQQKQLQYAIDQAATLRRMENDLERMNTLDPW